MKRILPYLLLVVSFFFFLQPVNAQLNMPGSSGGTPIPTPDVQYSPDPEVNFVGKSAARSMQFLNWTLTNYYWQCHKYDESVKACNNEQSPLYDFWITIRNIVYALFALFVLITAFIFMTTRGKSLTVKRFLPRFVIVVLLVTFSYALLQFIYVSTDIFQGFFLTKPAVGTNPQSTISAEDLLYVGWDYENFQGLRKVHSYFDESVFVNLLLARLTAITYYALAGILIIRKIILWFFIILSPIFPVLLLYYPVRNTAKIWIGEFFRWLMYAPLFSVFLAGLVAMWKSALGIPLFFSFPKSGDALIYPTATNILLGGPMQKVMIDNSLNTPDTFAEYVVALIMLWVVILLPFVLLQIFLDYLNSFSFNENPAMQKIIATSYQMLNKQPPPILPPPAPGSGGTGLARSLPVTKYGTAQQLPIVKGTGMARELPMPAAVSAAQKKMHVQMLGAARLSIPTMRDVARYEKQMLTHHDSDVQSTYESLQKIAKPELIASTVEKDRFVSVREQLSHQIQQGDHVAAAMLSAMNVVNNVSTVSNLARTQSVKNFKNNITKIANPQTVTSTVERERMTRLHDSLVKESQNNNQIASRVLATTKETSVAEMRSLHDALVTESRHDSQIATNVLATSLSHQETTKLQELIKELNNTDASTNSFSHEAVSQLRDVLVKESKEGNQLATTILNSKELNSTSSVQEIKDKLVDASLQGNKVASQILSTAITQNDADIATTVLEHIASPESITNTIDKERYTNLREKIVQAQQQGDSIANSIMTTITTIQQAQTTNLRSTLQQINNPAAIPQTASSVEREKIVQMHDTLVKESEKGNELAKTLLSVTKDTPIEEVKKIKDEVATEMTKGNTTAQEVSALAKTKETTKDVQNLKEQLAGAKTNAVAGEVLKTMQGQSETAINAALPQSNRVQSVSLEDYESVKKIWQENYKNIDVPEGISGRKAWISNEMQDIDNIIALLSSNDEEKIQEGMQEVSNILPFLLLGGFSQEEIIAYLKAKQAAGKEVLETIVEDESSEETMVSVRKQHKTASMTQSQTMQYSPSSYSEDAFEETSPLQQTRVQSVPLTVNTQALTLTNLPLPTLRDVVRFEISLLSRDTTAKQEVEKINQTLTQIANPSAITSTEERTRVEKMRDTLIQNQQQGDSVSTTILHAASTVSGQQITASEVQNVQAVITQLAHPETVQNAERQQQLKELKEKITQEAAAGNQTASAIVSEIQKAAAGEKTENSDIQQKIIAAKKSGEPIASSVIALTEETKTDVLPKTNRLQSVSLEDYEAIRSMWLENYANLELPAGVTDRKEWISQEITAIDGIVALLSSDNPEDIQKAMDQVSNILPFLLLGGFSQEEIVTYLKAKQEAGKSVLQTIDKEQSAEDTMVAVKATTPASHAAQQTSMNQEIRHTDGSFGTGDQYTVPMIHYSDEDISLSKSSPATDQSALVPLLTALQISIPKLQDLAHYEQALKVKEHTRKESIMKVLQLLKFLTNPALAKDEEDKEKLLALKKMLRKQKNDSLAVAVLRALNASKPESFSSEQLAAFRDYLQTLIVSKQGETEYPLFVELYQAIIQESQRGNQLARRLLSMSKDVVIPDIRQMKEQVGGEMAEGNEVAAVIASALLIQMEKKPFEKYFSVLVSQNKNERIFAVEKVAEMRQTLQRESESGNQFASILLALDEHDAQALQRATTQLVQQGREGNKIALQVLADIFAAQSVEEIRSAVVKLLTFHPSTTPKVNVLLQQQFQREQIVGSVLAGKIAKINDHTSDKDLLAIQELMASEAAAGNDFAEKLVDQLPDEIIAFGDERQKAFMLPQQNTVQTVSLEDYEAVREMWEENYEQAEMSDKAQWLATEQQRIDELITALSSTDEQKRKEGLEQVSHILPFFLLGGFSEQEIISYLKAKKQAASSVAKQLSKQESQVFVEEKKAHEQKTRAASEDKI